MLFEKISSGYYKNPRYSRIFARQKLKTGHFAKVYFYGYLPLDNFPQKTNDKEGKNPCVA